MFSPRPWIPLLSPVLALLSPLVAHALPVVDSTLGTQPLLVNPTQMQINGGTIEGQNLFHSFDSFNIDTGEAVYFFSPADVNHIFSRVTGGTRSEINGVLGTVGSNADLFFMNPNGVVFGSTASLDVQGSFMVTTADAIRLGADGVFSALDPTTDNLLSVDPSAFLFAGLGQSGEITNRSQITQLSRTNPSFEMTGLQVPDGKTLLLLSGNIMFDGGQLNARAGRVEIGAVSGAGEVKFREGETFLTLPDSLSRANIILNNSSQINVASRGGGDVTIQTNNLDILGNSSIFAGIGNGLGAINSRGGDIRIDATGILTISDRSNIGNLVSGAGAGGNIDVLARDIKLINGSQISASGFGAEDVGNVTLQASGTISLSGISTISLPGISDSNNISSSIQSIIVSTPAFLGQGNGGDIILQASNVELLDSASISSSAFFGPGDSGNIYIRADNFSATGGSRLISGTQDAGNAGDVVVIARNTARFDGTNANGSGSGAFSSTSSRASGTGGNIRVSAHTLDVTNGAQLNSSTSGSGDAGNIIVVVQDSTVINNGSRISSEAAARFINGSGGDIEISTNTLEIKRGAELRTSTQGNGDAGDITIVAEESAIFDNAIASSAVNFFLARGSGGNLQVTTNALDVINGARLTARTAGQGDAGSVVIEANELVNLQGFDDTGQPSGVFTGSIQLVGGRGNDIRIATPVLRIQDGAVLEASTKNDDPDNTEPLSGGNIVLDLGSLSLLNGGQIVTISRVTEVTNDLVFGTGSAGTILINATDGIYIAGSDPTFTNRSNQNPTLALEYSPQSSLSVRSEARGRAGNIIIGDLGTTPSLEIDGGQIIADSAEVNGGNIFLNLNNLLLLRNRSQINATAGTAQGDGDGGNITITAPLVVAIPEEDSDISANAFQGAGGRVNITAQGIFGIEPRSNPTPLSDITASSELGVSGVVNLNTLDTGFIENSLTELPEVLANPDALVASSCIARSQDTAGRFVVTNSDSLPPQPDNVGTVAYTLGEVSVVAENPAQASWSPGMPVVEPERLYQLTDGRLVISRECG